MEDIGLGARTTVKETGKVADSMIKGMEIVPTKVNESMIYIGEETKKLGEKAIPMGKEVPAEE